MRDRAGLGRRYFLVGAGLLGASALAPRVAAVGNDRDLFRAPVGGSREPSPIPWLDENGGHNQMPGPGKEPSSIFHFKGSIARANDFEGTGTDGESETLIWGLPSSDFSFMDGVFWPPDRIERAGTFSHLCLTIFRGSLTPEAKVHDLHPAIRANGLYWIVDVPAGRLDVAPNGRTATLKLTRLALIDQPRWPRPDAEARRARMDVHVVWTATDEKVVMDDPQKLFRFVGWRATCQAEARVEVPSIHFTWQSGPLASSKAKSGLIGQESNGRYYGGTA